MSGLRSTEARVHRGRRAERRAARWLEERGWAILSRNWRDGPRELDLVISRDGVLSFVEVKSRSVTAVAHPLASITWRKRREVERAAVAWLMAHSDRCRGISTFRFDAMAVHLDRLESAGIEHVAGAWQRGE